MTGKEKCDALRQVRRTVAEQNDISMEFPDCTHEGDCTGVCPACDAELAQLTEALKEKEASGAPVQVEPTEGLTFCRCCGSPILPGQKFCAHCGSDSKLSREEGDPSGTGQASPPPLAGVPAPPPEPPLMGQMVSPFDPPRRDGLFTRLKKRLGRK